MNAAKKKIARQVGMLNLGLIIMTSLGCSWVPLSEDGERVQVVANNEVTDCERVGNTKAKVLRKVWFIPRRESVVEGELRTLARNEGSKLGGNVVTPLPSKRQGEREFAVYVCGD
jgi:hypothetical protein